MHTQITFENFSVFADNYAKEILVDNYADSPLEINSPAEQFLPPLKLLEKKRREEEKKIEEQILTKVCDFLNYERTKILSTTLKEKVKESCVGRLCQALGITCAYNFKNEFFNFFSCIVGEAVSNILGYNLEIDEYKLKYIKVENTNLIHSARQMIENSNLDQGLIDVYNLAKRHKHLILELKRN